MLAQDFTSFSIDKLSGSTPSIFRESTDLISLVAQGKLGKHQAASREVHYQSNQVRQGTEDWQDTHPAAKHTWQC